MDFVKHSWKSVCNFLSQFDTDTSCIFLVDLNFNGAASITKEAFDKEIFGAPTFVVNDKIFWGQDRLEFAIDEYNN